MKFWFSSKGSSSPEKDSPAEAKPETSAPATPVAESEKPEEIPAPRLGPVSIKPTAPATPAPKADQPLQPATTLVRPQANQKVLYYQLMNGLYDAVLILDDNGHIVDCNNRVETILGYTRDEMWDMPVSTVVKGIGPQIFQQMKDALHGNHQVLINARCSRKDGEKFQGEVGVCIMTLTRGENLVFTIRNIEKRIAALRQQLLEEMKPAEAKPAAAKPRLVLKKVAPKT